MRVVLTQPSARTRGGSDFAYISGLLREKRFRGQPGDVIVLPELVGEGSSTPDYIAAVTDLAAEFGCHVVGGSHFASVDGQIINQGVVVDRHGVIIAQYEKANPYGGEREVSVAGEQAGARFSIEGVECFVLVCADF